MNVLYVYQGDWPRNATRPSKQTRALAAAGHRVHLLSGNPSGKPRQSSEEWLTVERLPSFGSRRLHRIFAFPIFFNPVWITAILRAARRCHADCIIVRDLPLAAAAVAVGQVRGVPVHFEMADVYPVGMRDATLEHPHWSARLTRNAAAAEAVERYVLRRVSRVFVVSEESRERCLRLGVAAERAVVVGNTPENLDVWAATYPIPPDIADWEGRPLVVFIGNLLPSRGLPEAIDAIAMVARDAPEIGFVIAGDGREEHALRTHVAMKRLGDNVRLVGWKPAQVHPAYCAQAIAGILPFRATQHICITLANKLFDCMAAALPIVASDVPPMRRILNETGAGLLSPPGDAAGFARSIRTLVQDPSLRRRLGDAGRRAVETKYHWDVDRRRFLEAIERAHVEN